MNSRRALTIGLLFLLIGGAWALVARQDEKGRATTVAVWDLWTDVLRDADHFGLRLTRVSDAEEMALGDRLTKSFQPSRDEKAQKYLEEVGAALTPTVRRKRIHYTFHLVDLPMINAFAIPGGHIFVTKRMLDFIETEAELAGLLGHEIAHVDLRHCIEQFQYQMQLEKVTPGLMADLTGFIYHTLTVGYSRQQEQEADINAVKFAAGGAYHPKHTLSLFDRMDERSGRHSSSPHPLMTEELASSILAGLGDYLKSHPDFQYRISDLAHTLAKNEADWRSRTFYVGRSNLADRVSRASDSREGERAPYDEPPGLRPYLADDKQAPFRAFAAHTPSGLSASAGAEPTPERAIEAATSACEKKMAPCALYALGPTPTATLEAAQIEALRQSYRSSACANNPPENIADACRTPAAAEKPGSGVSAKPRPQKFAPRLWRSQK
jgi:beta-barrel assembly-enhancing protease